MKIQQENIHEYLKIREIREHFLSWTIPVIRYLFSKQLSTPIDLESCLWRLLVTTLTFCFVSSTKHPVTLSNMTLYC